MTDPRAVQSPPQPRGLRTAPALDTGDIVDRWMAAQLAIERQYHRRLGDGAGRRARLLTLLELDAVTQLDPQGQTVEQLADTLAVGLPAARAAVRALVRRGLLVRVQRPEGQRVVQRTTDADQMIELLRSIQSDLIASIMDRLEPDLRLRLVELLKARTLSHGAVSKSGAAADPDHRR